MMITLSIAISSNPRTWPILDGTVKPDGIDLVPTILEALGQPADPSLPGLSLARTDRRFAGPDRYKVIRRAGA